MKKRNKKTGKVQTCDFMVISDDISRDGEIARLNSHVFIFRSIEQLNEEYEDYKPTEPLIKDEKIRKAVRAWAEVDGIDAVEIVSKYQLISLDEQCSIELFAEIYPEYTHNEEHTIAELCGEATDEA